MKLIYQEYGTPNQTPLVILHGMCGSKKNWHSIANACSKKMYILTFDLRNHGDSPHSSQMDYVTMAKDIQETLSEKKLTQINLLGHSMGGKVAMTFALLFPKLVNKLIIEDIAPVTYKPRLQKILLPLLSLPLESLKSRKEADQYLSECLPDRSLRQFLLTNLIQKEGRVLWKINLKTIVDSMPILGSFPELQKQFDATTWFVYGEKSDYMKQEYIPIIKSFFPNTIFHEIKDAGHWIHSEQPEVFQNYLMEVLFV